jgi:hypothetical protein
MSLLESESISNYDLAEQNIVIEAVVWKQKCR